MLLLLLLVPPPPPPTPLVGLGFLVTGLKMFMEPVVMVTGVFSGVKLFRNVLSKVLSKI